MLTNEISIVFTQSRNSQPKLKNLDEFLSFSLSILNSKKVSFEFNNLTIVEDYFTAVFKYEESWKKLSLRVETTNDSHLFNLE